MLLHLCILLLLLKQVEYYHQNLKLMLDFLFLLKIGLAVFKPLGFDCPTCSIIFFCCSCIDVVVPPKAKAAV
jgi:hypothetical protein